MPPLMRLADLAGRTAVVTGSSAGIGRAVAAALREQGCAVFGFDVTPPPAAAAAPLPPAAPATAAAFTHVPCDLRQPAAIASAVARLPPALDYVVNVAGRDPKLTLAEGGLEAWEDVVGLNLRGQYLLLREAEARLRCGSGKAVVNISSINYRLGVPRRSIYTTSKAGVLGLTRGLARELGAAGIRINTVSPGWVWTEAQRTAYFDHPDPGEAAKFRDYVRGVQALPDVRIGPEDIAAHVLFLLSNVSRATTGTNTVVDAGWLLE